MSPNVKMEVSPRALSRRGHESQSTTPIPNNIAVENPGREEEELVQAINGIEHRGITIQNLDSLPSIHKGLQEQLFNVDAELAHLPEPPAVGAIRVVLDTINAFTEKISKQIKGDHSEDEFRIDWKELRNRFRDRITAQRPTMLVKTAADVPDAMERVRSGSPPPRNRSQAYSPSRREDVISFGGPDTERGLGVQHSPTKKRKVASEGTILRLGLPGDEHTKRFDLDYIRRTLPDNHSSNIPNVIDPKALDYLILKTLEGWEHPTEELLDGLQTALRRTVNQALVDTLKEWKDTELFRETARLSTSFLDVAFGEQRDEAVPRALKLERHTPVAEDAAALAFNEKQELEVFLNARIQARTNIYFDELDASTGKRTSKANRQRKANDLDFRSQLGPDPFSREVEAMSKVRGYYNVASMRYVDAVIMGFQAELFETLKEDLRGELITGLDIFGENSQVTCARLLEEDPTREMRRCALRADKKRLVAVLDSLREWHQKYRQDIAITTHSSNGTGGSGLSDADY